MGCTKRTNTQRAVVAAVAALAVMGASAQTVCPNGNEQPTNPTSNLKLRCNPARTTAYTLDVNAVAAHVHDSTAKARGTALITLTDASMFSIVFDASTTSCATACDKVELTVRNIVAGGDFNITLQGALPPGSRFAVQRSEVRSVTFDAVVLMDSQVVLLKVDFKVDGLPTRGRVLFTGLTSLTNSWFMVNRSSYETTITGMSKDLIPTTLVELQSGASLILNDRSRFVLKLTSVRAISSILSGLTVNILHVGSASMGFRGDSTLKITECTMSLSAPYATHAQIALAFSMGTASFVQSDFVVFDNTITVNADALTTLDVSLLDLAGTVVIQSTERGFAMVVNKNNIVFKNTGTSVAHVSQGAVGVEPQNITLVGIKGDLNGRGRMADVNMNSLTVVQGTPPLSAVAFYVRTVEPPNDDVTFLIRKNKVQSDTMYAAYINTVTSPNNLGRWYACQNAFTNNKGKRSYRTEGTTVIINNGADRTRITEDTCSNIISMLFAPPSLDTVTVTKVARTTTSAVALASGAPTGLVRAGMIGAVSSVSQCRIGARDLTEDVELQQNVFGLKLGPAVGQYNRGGIVGGGIIVLIFAVCLAALAVLLTFSNFSDHTLPDDPMRSLVSRIATAVFAPGSLLAAMILAMEGWMTNGTTLMSYENAPAGDIIFGAIMCCLSVAYMVHIVVTCVHNAPVIVAPTSDDGRNECEESKAKLNSDEQGTFGGKSRTTSTCPTPQETEEGAIKEGKHTYRVCATGVWIKTTMADKWRLLTAQEIEDQRKNGQLIFLTNRDVLKYSQLEDRDVGRCASNLTKPSVSKQDTATSLIDSTSESFNDRPLGFAGGRSHSQASNPFQQPQSQTGCMAAIRRSPVWRAIVVVFKWLFRPKWEVVPHPERYVEGRWWIAHWGVYVADLRWLPYRAVEISIGLIMAVTEGLVINTIPVCAARGAILCAATAALLIVVFVKKPLGTNVALITTVFVTTILLVVSILATVNLFLNREKLDEVFNVLILIASIATVVQAVIDMITSIISHAGFFREMLKQLGLLMQRLSCCRSVREKAQRKASSRPSLFGRLSLSRPPTVDLDHSLL